MQYRIRLIQSEEGWAVSCPALTGCHSQGATREEAVENIKFAESHSDNLIQLADMVAGAIARSYRQGERKDADRWRLMLASKIEIIREFEG